jgi:plasmid replication DNA-binding protein KfrA
MTIEEVRIAKEAVERDGRYASHKAVHDYLGRGSKRDIQKYLAMLPKVIPRPTPTPPPAKAPAVQDPPGAPQAPVVEPDPAAEAWEVVAGAQKTLAHARADLETKEAELGASRTALLDATGRYAAAQGVMSNGVRVGGLMPGDPSRYDLQRAVAEADEEYRADWVARQQALEALSTAQTALTEAVRAHWVATQAPELLAEVRRLEQHQASLGPEDDRARYLTRHALMQARQAYGQALMQAPTHEHLRFPETRRGAVL